MMWFGLLIMFGGLVVLFVLWDLVFCGGRRCGELRSRATNLFRDLGGKGRRQSDLVRRERAAFVQRAASALSTMLLKIGSSSAATFLTSGCAYRAKTADGVR